MAKSPFEALGLSQGIVQRLRNNDKTLSSLVQAVYRVLMLEYHPDRGGTDARAQEINQAYDLLKDKESFLYEKEKFLKKHSPVKNLKNKIEESDDEKNQLINLLHTHFKSPKQGDISIHGLKNLTLELVDMDTTRGNNKMIEIDKYGSIYENIPQKIGINKKGSNIHTYNIPQHTAQWESKRIIGSVPHEMRDIFLSQLNSPYADVKKFPAHANLPDKVPICYTLSKDMVDKIIHLIEPKITKESYLLTHGKQGYSLEGKIIDIKDRSFKFIEIGDRAMQNNELYLALAAYSEADASKNLITLANKAMKKDNLDLALTAYIESKDMKKLEEFGDVLFEQGKIFRASCAYLRTGNKKKIKELGDFISEKNPSFASFLYGQINSGEGLADLNLNKGNLKKALEQYKNLLRRRQTSKSKFIDIGKSAVENGDLELALDAFKTIKNNKKLIWLGEIAEKKRNFDIAIEAYTKANAPNRVGELYLNNNELGAAYRIFLSSQNTGKIRETGYKALEKNDLHMAYKCFDEIKFKKEFEEIGDRALKTNDLRLTFNAYDGANSENNPISEKILRLVNTALKKGDHDVATKAYDIIRRKMERGDIEKDKRLKNIRKMYVATTYSSLVGALDEYAKSNGKKDLVQLAEFFYKKGEKNVALKAYEVANVWGVNCWEKMAKLQIEQGFLDAVFETYKNVKKEIKDKFLELGSIAEKKHRWRVAFHSFERAKAKKKIVSLRDILFKEKEFGLAAKSYELFGDFKRAGDIYFKSMKNWDGALEAYQKVNAKQEILELSNACIKKNKLSLAYKALKFMNDKEKLAELGEIAIKAKSFGIAYNSFVAGNSGKEKFKILEDAAMDEYGRLEKTLQYSKKREKSDKMKTEEQKKEEEKKMIEQIRKNVEKREGAKRLANQAHNRYIKLSNQYKKNKK